MSLILLAVVVSLGGALGDRLVITPKGPINGQDGGSYFTYLGVPYALVNESNPFGKSLPYPDFSEPFQATDSTIKCPQAVFVATGELQCLRLNIYVPKTPKRNLPVFVWFHGGAYLFGSAGEYNPRHLIQHGIIAVTVNYRLGPYGFLCLNTDEVPGNQGLKDQVSALKWVKDNIQSFGGDPRKLTIAGESYGGGSVELHLYSQAEKLFDKAIIQSGAAEEEGMFVHPNENAAFTIAKVLNSDIKRDDSLSFLSQTDPISVVKAFNTSDILLRVCKEKVLSKGENFITADSFLYAPERVRNTPIMVGYNSKEMFAEFVQVSNDYYEKEPNIFVEKMDFNFRFDKDMLQTVATSIKKFYLGDKPISKDAMLELADFASDFMVNYPTERGLTRFLNQSAVIFKYLFSYTGNSPYKNITGYGAYHTEELQYLFDWNEAGELTGEDNLTMRDKMTKMWANFVKIGNPTPCETSLLPVKWERMVSNQRQYLDINRKMKMKANVYEDRMKFWQRFWDMYYEKYYFLNVQKQQIL